MARCCKILPSIHIWPRDLSSKQRAMQWSWWQRKCPKKFSWPLNESALTVPSSAGIPYIRITLIVKMSWRQWIQTTERSKEKMDGSQEWQQASYTKRETCQLMHTYIMVALFLRWWAHWQHAGMTPQRRPLKITIDDASVLSILASCTCSTCCKALSRRTSTL